MREVLLSFFYLFENYRTLSVPAKNYIKYCFSQIVTPNFLSQKHENLESLARGKLFQLPYLRRSIASSYSYILNLKVIKRKTEIGSCRTPLAPLFRIGRLQYFTSSCAKLFKILLLLISYIRLSVPKSTTGEKFGLSEALLTSLSNKRQCLIL